MDQPLTRNDSLGEPQVQLMIVVEMREGFASVAEGGKAILSPRKWTMLHAQLLESVEEPTAQIDHPSTSRVNSYRLSEYDPRRAQGQHQQDDRRSHEDRKAHQNHIHGRLHQTVHHAQAHITPGERRVPELRRRRVT